MTEDRRVSFGYNSEIGVRLKNPVIKVHQDFDLSKDTKFSMRTLLLLCVFCIGVFGFGINPNFFGYDLATNYRSFVAFCLFVLVGQTFIAVFQYRLNRGKLRRHLQMYNQEVERLEAEYNSEQSKVVGAKRVINEALAKTFPQDFQGKHFENKEQLQEAVDARLNELKSDCVIAKKELKDAKREKLDTEMVYKWINGKITFGLALVAFVLGCFALWYDGAVVERIWQATNSEQYILLNIKHLDTKCLVHTNSLTTLSEIDIFSNK